MSKNGVPYPAPKRLAPAFPHTPNLKAEFGTREEWEESIFRNAGHYNVWRFGYVTGGEVFTTASFSEALYVACSNDRACLYVVAVDGAGFCMGREDYKKYADMFVAARVEKEGK